MKLYRFSPIDTLKQLMEAVVYVSVQASELGKKITGKTFPISSLTVFAHYPEEYEKLCKILAGQGRIVGENNGPRFLLQNPVKAGDTLITHVRVRKPDPYRMQVGCSDFDVEGYRDFKQQYLSKHPDNLRCIERTDYEMIEFFNPDFDVLAYIVSTKVHG